MLKTAMLLVGHILCILSLCFIFPKEKFAYFHRRAKVDWVGTVGWEQKAVPGQTGFLSFPHCINYKFILCPILLMVFLLSLKYSSWGETFNCGIAEYEWSTPTSQEMRSPIFQCLWVNTWPNLHSIRCIKAWMSYAAHWNQVPTNTTLYWPSTIW